MNETTLERHRKCNSMTVTGKGAVTAVPDLAILRLGVQTTEPNLAQIQSENAAISQNILHSLHQMGITDIKTFQYQIERVFDFENGVRIDRGFSVRNLLEIRTNQLDLVGAIIDTAVNNGANLVELISFEVSGTDEYYLEALSLALMNAMQKAMSMADDFGVPLDPVPIKIVENSSPPVPYARTFLGEDALVTPIVPGTTRIEATVTVEFIY